MNNPMMGMKEWLLLVILSIFWGGAFFFNEIVLWELQPFTVVLIRIGLAALTLFLWVLRNQQQMPTDLSTWGAFLVMGFLNNLLPFTLIVWGQQYIASGVAAILIATTPLFSVVLAHFLTTEEHLTLNRVIGVLAGMLGVIVLIGVDAIQEVKLQNLAQVAILGSACSYAFAAIYGRRFKKLSPLVASTGMLLAATALMLPVVLWFEPPWKLQLPQISTWAALGGLAFLSTALAYLIYFHILAVAGATNILLVTFLVPVSALLLGTFILGEPFSFSLLGGMALIFAGLVVVDGRFLKR